VPRLPAQLDEQQARARNRVSTVSRDRTSQRSVTSAVGLGAWRLFFSPTRMLGGVAGRGRYLRSGVEKTRQAVRGLVRLEARAK
jgi:hypothetical protein